MFGIVALVIAILHLIRPSIVLLTGGLIAAGFGIVLYNIGLSGMAIGLLILDLHAPRPPQRNGKQEIHRAGPQRLPVIRAFVEHGVNRGARQQTGKHRLGDRAVALRAAG